MKDTGVLPLTGVILAGGSNRRMGGKVKALLSLNGRELFIERQLAEMSKICSEILIITNEPPLFEQQLSWPLAQVRTVQDLQPGKGPLAGMQAAMAAAQYNELWVVACDMPHLSSLAAKALVELRQANAGGKDDAAVPYIKGRLQPLHAIYHKRCRSIIDELLAEGQHRMMVLLNLLSYAAAEDSLFMDKGVSLSFTDNINTPEDLESLKKLEPGD